MTLGATENHGRCEPRPRSAAQTSAFTLLELMLSIAIMGVLVTAMYAVFDQTQRAMRANANQVDVLESGRTTMDLIAREAVQMTAAGFVRSANFVSLLTQPPLVQALPSSPGYRGVLRRTNVLDQWFFLTRLNQQYIGTSYRVAHAENGVGVLARFSTNIPVRLFDPDFVNLVMRQPLSNHVVLAEGVIHFRVRAYDGDGMVLSYATTNHLRYRPLIQVVPENAAPTETRYAFLGDALPGAVEVELGVLEPATYEQYKSFAPGSAMALSFLSNHVGQVQLFHGRIGVPQSGSFYAAYQ